MLNSVGMLNHSAKPQQSFGRLIVKGPQGEEITPSEDKEVRKALNAHFSALMDLDEAGINIICYKTNGGKIGVEALKGDKTLGRNFSMSLELPKAVDRGVGLAIRFFCKKIGEVRKAVDFDQ